MPWVQGKAGSILLGSVIASFYGLSLFSSFLYKLLHSVAIKENELDGNKSNTITCHLYRLLQSFEIFY
jgi:hypothetical protein